MSLLPRMSAGADGRAVVTDADGRVIGIVSSADIGRSLARAQLHHTDPYPPRRADLHTAPGTP